MATTILFFSAIERAAAAALAHAAAAPIPASPQNER
jgi:hypothetical protein